MKRSLKNDKMKTYAEINEKIKKGTAVVLTAEEVSELSKTLSPKEIAEKVDVVTTATFGCIFEFRSFQSPNPDGEDRIERRPGQWWPGSGRYLCRRYRL